jgi:HSP20 family protein
MPSGRRPTTRPPDGDLARLQRDFNELLERLAVAGREDAMVGGWSPAVDVYEAKGTLVVVAEVPGLAPESLKVAAQGGELVISGERRERKPAGAQGFLCMERPQGRFSRRIPLDEALDVRAASARLSGGLLRVSIPRLKERRCRETAIPVEREE